MSDFWVRKMSTYFSRIDFDKDGAVTRNDFEGMAARFVQTGKLDATKSKDMHDTLLVIWDKYLSRMCKNGGISLENFIEAMKQVLADPTKTSIIEGPLPLFFHCVDTNNDRLIQVDEYVRFFQIIGIDEKMAPESFAAIDANHDGDISLEEFILAGTSFFLSEDESNPSKLFWGPLV